MTQRTIEQKTFASVLFVAAVAHLGGCSKAVVDNTRTEAHPQMSLASSNRVVEIDRLLSAPLSGTPEDSDRRATLRAERLALTGAAVPVSMTRTAPMPGLEPSVPRNTSIVVARDSRGNHEPHQLSRVEAMMPSERKRYYEEIRARNTQTHVVVPVYAPRRQ